jgi:hypothetical protein
MNLFGALITISFLVLTMIQGSILYSDTVCRQKVWLKEFIQETQNLMESTNKLSQSRMVPCQSTMTVIGGKSLNLSLIGKL